MNQKTKNKLFFLKKNAQLDKRIREDVLDNNIAYIPCNVCGMDDIISHYSVKGHETLNPEFREYIKDYADSIPAEYPIVIDICGHDFMEEEKEIIRSTIEDDFFYEMGSIQLKNRKNLLLFIFMAIGMIVSGVLISVFANAFAGLLELFYVVFWFCADMVVAFIIIDGREQRESKILSGRLASAFVQFDKTFDERSLTEEEATEVMGEIFNE